MFEHILLPLDGSHLAETVLPIASLLAQKLGSSVTLIHVIEKKPPEEIHGQVHLKDPEEAQQYLLGISSNTFPATVRVEAHVHTTEVNNVAKSIADHAGELKQDLIIMCSHGKSGIRDWLFGSIAQQVIALGKTPVLLIQPDADGRVAPFDCQQILVPVDANPEHERCIQSAQTLCVACSSNLHLLTVVPTSSTLEAERAAVGKILPATMAAMLELTEENAASYLAHHSAELRKAGLPVSAQVVRGDPASAIIETARKINAGLIVLGTHGKTGQEAFWAGSVTPRVASQTRIPLLLVPV